MNILFLAPYSEIKGPLPKLAAILVESLQKLGMNISTAKWSAHDVNEPIIDKILYRPIDILSIVRCTIINKCDLLIVTTTHDWKAVLRDLPLLLVVRLLSPKIIMHFHGSFSNLLVSNGNWLLKKFTKLILLLSDGALLFSTEEIRDWKKFHPTGKFFYVNNPYEPKRDHQSSKEFNLEKPTIFFAGRLIEEKGIFDLVEAASLLSADFNFELVVAGFGPDKDRLIEKINEFGLQNKVKLVGYLEGDALDQAYRSASIFVLPSWREGFPLVLVEAMDYGLPIVTTRIRGAVDRMKEGENALFVSPKNPGELAIALRNLLTDPALMGRMSENNQRLVLDYLPGKVGKEYLDIFQKVIGESSI